MGSGRNLNGNPQATRAGFERVIAAFEDSANPSPPNDSYGAIVLPTVDRIWNQTALPPGNNCATSSDDYADGVTDDQERDDAHRPDGHEPCQLFESAGHQW